MMNKLGRQELENIVRSLAQDEVAGQINKTQNKDYKDPSIGDRALDVGIKTAQQLISNPNANILVGTLGAPIALSLANGIKNNDNAEKIINDASKKLYKSVGSAVAIAFTPIFYTNPVTAILATGLTSATGHIAGGLVYEAVSAVTNFFRSSSGSSSGSYQPPTGPITSYSGGRDPFTGQGLGLKINLYPMAPPFSSDYNSGYSKLDTYKTDNSMSFSDYNNSFSLFSNGNNGNGGGPFGGGSGPDGGGYSGFINSLYGNGMISYSQLGGYGSNSGNWQGMDDASFYSQMASMTQGYTSKSDLAASLYAFGLAKSFNGYNGKFSMPGKSNGQIGGVATKSGEMKNLLQTDAEIQDQWIVLIKCKDGEKPATYSNLELQTILRELASAVYLQNTFPFYSLHFNDFGVLFSIIHPAYENTLVGEVISFLDYYLKGFLNGGVYEKSFLDKWHQNLTTDREKLKPFLIDLGKQFKKQGIQYHSLRQLMAQYGLEGQQIDNKSPFRSTKFMTSFRIISEVKSVQKYSNLLQVECDFDVQYTIQLMPSYKDELEKHQKQFGKFPQDYLKLQILYKRMADQVKQIMPKLSRFKYYFDLLKLISFASSYYSTLQKMQKVPMLQLIDDKKVIDTRYNVPKAFPPIPVKYYSFHKLNIKLGQVLKSINQAFPALPLIMDKILNDYLEKGQCIFTPQLIDHCRKNISNLIKSQIQQPNQQVDINENYVNSCINGFQITVKVLVSRLQEKIFNLIKELNTGMMTFSPKAELIQVQKLNQPVMKKVVDKIAYIKQILQKFFTLKTAINLQNNQKQYQKILKKYDDQLSEFLKNDQKRRLQNKASLKKEQALLIAQLTKNIEDQKQSAIKALNVQAQQVIKASIAQIPNPNLYSAQIETIKQNVRNQVSANITKISANAQKLKKQRAEVISKLTLQADKKNIGIFDAQVIQAKAKIKQAKDTVTKNNNAVRLSIDEQIKKQKSGMQTSITSLQNEFKFISKTLIDLKDVHDINLAQKKYLNSKITIADAGYYKDIGDNFKIIGGCGLKMNEINVQAMSLGSEKYSQCFSGLQKSKRETLTIAKINGKEGNCFKTRCRNGFNFLFQRVLLSKNTMFCSNDPKKNVNLLQKEEFELIKKLSGEAKVTQAEIKNHKYNWTKQSTKGLKISHISSVFIQNPANLIHIKHLLSEKDRKGNMAIHIACTNERYEIVKQIIKLDNKYLEEKNYRGNSPLLCAILCHDSKMVELLCSLGANINYRMPNGMTPLLLATSRGLTTISKILLKKCSVQQAMPTGDTALHYSIRNSDFEVGLMISKLMKNIEGARSKSNGYNPFHQAASSGATAIVQQMLNSKKILPNSLTDIGESALHLAVQNDHLQLVKLLVQKYGFDSNVMNKNQETPLMKSIYYLSSKCALYLSTKQKINLVDRSKSTCSLLAIKHNMIQVVESLHKRGQDLKKTNNIGETVEEILKRNGELTMYTQIKGNAKIVHPIKINLITIKQMGILVANRKTKAVMDKLEELIDVAIQCDEISILQIWLDSNHPPLKVQDKLAKACQSNSHRCVSAILKKYKQDTLSIINEKLILLAIGKSGSWQCYNILCEYIQNPNSPLDNLKTSFGHLVAEYGYLGLARQLIRVGVKFNLTNSLNLRPIDICIENDDLDFSQFLIDLYPQDKIPSFIHKQQCCKLLQKSMIGGHNITKLNFTTKRQIGNRQKALLAQAIKSGNITLIDKMVMIGCKLNQKIGNYFPIQLTIQNNDFRTFMFLLSLFKGDKQQIKSIANPDLIKQFIKHQRISMLIEIMKNIDLKQRQNLKTNILLKSQQKANKYLLQIFTSGTSNIFIEDMKVILDSVFALNHKIFIQKIKGFPINELFYDARLKPSEQIKRPLIFYLYQHDFASAIAMIAQRINPNIKDEAGYGIGVILIRNSANSKILLEYTRKYFNKYLIQIFSQTHNNLTIIQLAHSLGKKQIVDQIYKMSSIFKQSKIDSEGNTLLHIAIKTNDYDTVKRLVQTQFKNNIDIRNSKKRTPLSIACEKNQQYIAQLLLKNKANPNIKDLAGNNCLHYCFLSSRTEKQKEHVSHLILNNIKDIDETNRNHKTVLMLAQGYQDEVITKLLIAKGAKISIKDDQGMSALHYAVVLNKYENVKVLVEAGCDIDIMMQRQQKLGQKRSSTIELNTPAHFAARLGYQKILSYLYHNGANFTMKNSNQQTVLECAIQSNSSMILQMFKRLPQFYDDKNAISLLQACCKSDNFDALLMFMHEKFNLHCIDKVGKNLLHFCAMYSSVKCLLILLKQQVSPNSRDSLGNIPVHYSCYNNSIKSLKALLPYSAMNEQNNDGNTPMHIAVMNNSEVMVKYMLSRRVSYKAKNGGGLTPSQLALVSGNKLLIALFFVLKDPNLYQHSHLQDYFQKKIKQNQSILADMSAIYEKQNKNMILACISLRNKNALKLFLQLNIMSLLKDPNRAKILQSAQQFPEGLYIIQTSLNQFSGITPFQYSPKQIEQLQQNLYKYQSKIQIKEKANITSNKRKKINKQYEDKMSNIFDETRLMMELVQGPISMFGQNEIFPLFEKAKIFELSQRQSTLFYLGIINTTKEKRKQFALRIFKLLTFLVDIKSKQETKFFDLVCSTFLNAYPWNLITEKLQNYIQQAYKEKDDALSNWFFSYFEPILIPNIQIQLQKAFVTWSKFTTAVKKQNYRLLPERPNCRLSFCLRNAQPFLNCLNFVQKSASYLPGNNATIKMKYLSSASEELQPSIRVSLIGKKYLNRFYSVTLRQIEQFIISSRPQGINILSEIQKFMNDQLFSQKQTYMNESEWLILLNKILSIIKVKENSVNRVSLFLQMANRVMKYLGKWHFYHLFCQQKLGNAGFSTYIRIAELLIDIENPIEGLLILENSKLSLAQIQKCLNVLYSKCLSIKFPQKNREDIKKDFTKQTQFVKYPLSQAQFTEISVMYDQIQKLSQFMSSQTREYLSTTARKLALIIKSSEKTKKISELKKAKVDLIAIIREQIRRIHQIFPYNTQIYVLLILLHGQEIENWALKGRIGQIRTGEGKSTIVVMLAAYFALQGTFVDIITSSPYLASRDEQKYRAFFNSLSLTCSCISVREGQPKRQKFDGHILFGTNYDFQFAILRDEIYNLSLKQTRRYDSPILQKRQCELVIVDQVDSLFVDMAFNSARLATQSPFNISWIYDIIYNYVKQCLENKKQANPDGLKERMIKFNNRQHRKQIQEFQLQKFQNWIQSAQKAISQYQQNKDYIIKLNETTGLNEVVIVDFENTGRLKIGSRWSNGLHQIVEIKHNIKPKDQNLTIASISHPAFFSQYQKIYGVSGTMGTQEQRIQITKIYNVDIKDIPPHFPNQRIRNQLKLTSETQFYESLIVQINQIKKFKRPVLIIFKSIKQSNEFSSTLLKHKIQHFILNEAQKQHQNYIISKAGSESAVTIATNTAGRGTDIILTPESKKNGGLHVIVAFYPINSRVQDQGLGRSGRQGQKGSCRVSTHFNDQQIKKIISAEELQLKLKEPNKIGQKLQSLRNMKISLLSKERQLISVSQSLKYQILARFCVKLNAIRKYFVANQKEWIFTLSCTLQGFPLQNQRLKSLYKAKQAQIKQFYSNALILNFSKMLHQHILHLYKNFMTINKETSIESPVNASQGILKTFLNIQIQLLIQKWSIVYSNSVTNTQISRFKMQNIWNLFNLYYLKKYQKDILNELVNNLTDIYLVSMADIYDEQIAKISNLTEIKAQDSEGWTKVLVYSGEDVILCHNGALTSKEVQNLKIKDIGWSDNERTMKTNYSWIVENVTFSTQFQKPEVKLTVYEAIRNVLNGLTPTGTNWKLDYEDGYLHYKGIMRTYGKFDKFYQGMYGGKPVYYEIGKEKLLRTGGWKNHTGEQIHTSCSDYSRLEYSITKRVNWPEKRVLWIRRQL